MQEFNPLKDGDYISDGPSQINKNIESVASDFCGTSFPTTNLFLGMVCYRTDENKIYRLRQQTNNDLVWVMEYALTDGGITAKQAESLTDTLPITGGGTGANTKANARTNLGIFGTKTETWTFTLADGGTASKKVVLE